MVTCRSYLDSFCQARPGLEPMVQLKVLPDMISETNRKDQMLEPTKICDNFSFIWKITT